jgi:hypothetical protein
LRSADSPLFRYLGGPRPQGKGLLSDAPSASTASAETTGK